MTNQRTELIVKRFTQHTKFLNGMRLAKLGSSMLRPHKGGFVLRPMVILLTLAVLGFAGMAVAGGGAGDTAGAV
jgi:hypothetical protein